ncbi:MAG: arsenosugar biosynthesis radical SAM (seleno)protein ArsS [Pseudomonadota bacterium]
MSAELKFQDARHPNFPAVCRDELKALQVNLGYRCNQACHHCHVDAGPNRTEMMDEATIELVLEFARSRNIELVDLTGGAPELNPLFRTLVMGLRDHGIAVIDRCNLTVLEEPGQADLAKFLADQGAKIVASLPCHGPERVDVQRGKGVFEKSIRGLQQLNQLGYGKPHTGLEIDLVHNPLGPSLPPAQGPLEKDYKLELGEKYGILFNQLLTITNMPIARFRHALIRDGEFEKYMQTLVGAFDVSNLPGLMCRTLISVDWRGFVYDCDFNQMLGLPLGASTSQRHLSDLLRQEFNESPINVADHCFGCTAGQGSSCGGALS